MYLDISEIESIQIDHTSRCNLLCPQCARVVKGKVNPNLPMGELTVDDYKIIFPKEIIKNIKLITQCGNYGDVVASNTILDCLDWLRTNGYKGHINVITNGSARTASWWKELAKILGRHGKVTFSIDGLRDTNHLYRVNSQWDKIRQNIKTYIDAGGRARWDFLVFEHNEHQIEKAKALAQKLGFESFYVKKTSRFISNRNYVKNTSVEQIDVKIKQEPEKDIVLKSNTEPWEFVSVPDTITIQDREFGALDKPSKEHQTNIGSFDNIIDKFGSWDNYVNQTEIDCKFRKQKALFVDFEARLWPCTWTGAPIYFEGKNNVQKIQLHKILDHYGWNFNSLRHHSLDDVLNHSWLKAELETSWRQVMNPKKKWWKRNAAIGKLMSCGRTCGTSYDFSSSSEKNRELTTF